MAFKMLCRNQPISDDLRMAVQGKRTPDVRRNPVGNQRPVAPQYSSNNTPSMQGNPTTISHLFREHVLLH